MEMISTCGPVAQLRHASVLKMQIMLIFIIDKSADYFQD